MSTENIENTDSAQLPWASYLEHGALSHLDLSFADLIGSLCSADSKELRLGAALATHAPGLGHVCAQLSRLAGQQVLDREGQPLELPPWPQLEPWLKALRSSRAVGDGSQDQPLVLDAQGDLYLRKLWRQQQRLAGSLLARSRRTQPVDSALLKTGLDRLFAGAEPGDLQRQACAMGTLRSFTVISGGPGTGKTTTVAKLLILIQEQALSQGKAQRLLLLAPTGKAAARVSESLQKSFAELDLSDALQDALPTAASTIHRALGYQPRTPTSFRHNQGNPLPAEVVLVDEASMVDLSLMAKLVDAVPQGARLILLGDQNQLASVEAGAILGDLCNTGGVPRGMSQDFARRLEELGGAPQSLPPAPPGPQDCIVELTHSWRFDASSGIGALAGSIKAGDAPGGLEVLQSESFSDVHMCLTAQAARQGPAGVSELRQALRTGFQPLCVMRDPVQALDALARFRVLCAHRRGRWGVGALNQLTERILSHQGLIQPGQLWYSGRPVMVTRNDYTLGLFNGDVGVAIQDSAGQLKVWFQGEQGTLRGLHPARLPPHETVYATTVHKSQGSEFESVALILPAHRSPLLTRELLYTGVTRARSQVTLYGSPLVFSAAVSARIQRASGLRAALWTPQESC